MIRTERDLPWVVGIGASAGGLEALSAFISHFPSGFPGAVIVAQHLAPKSKSMMVELLARQTETPIVNVSNGQVLEPGKIYVVPPNMDIDISDGNLVLVEAGPETRPKPSVDLFFSSLARAFGDRAIGIVLSGTGTDGSDGVRAIRAAGGITIAQDGHSAKYDGMPVSAVQTGSVDAVLSPESMAKNLAQIIEAHLGRKNIRLVEDEHLMKLLECLKKKGRDFTQYKLSTIRRRVARRLNTLGLKEISEYLSILEKSPGEAGELSQELLVSVTTFFRDPEIWDEFKNILAEQIKKKSPGQEFRAWVAGCATGEEAYTLAMVLADLQRKYDCGLHIKVFATDLDQDAVLEARNGIYEEADIKNVSKSFRDRFLHERGDKRVEVAKTIRDMVVFARQDLVQNPPFVKLDLVTCRNVLIYFEPPLQSKVIETFHYALDPSGIMLLGKSESPVGGNHLFNTLDRKAKIFEKINVPSNVFPSAMMSKSIESLSLPKAIDTKMAIPEKAFVKLIAAYDMAGAIVDKDGNIVHVIGDTSPYLQLSSGHADFRISALLPVSVGIEVPLLIKKATKNWGVVRSRTHEIHTGVKTKKYKVAVRPMADNESDTKFRNLFLVNFEVVAVKERAPRMALSENELPVRFRELEQELQQTREHLQLVIEELGVSNEELQSLNEELSSTNEELQASNEELETTNEELQSSNEELTTVNEELAVKSVELRKNNTELQNVYSSIGSPLLVVDENLRVIKYNEQALKIFDLSPKLLKSDVTRLSASCELPDFKEKILSTIRDGKIEETICEGSHALYQLRSHPFYDETRRIVGAILIFFENTSEIRTKRLLEGSESRVTSIINSSRSLISLKDTLGRYILVNRAFADFFGVGIEQIIGKTDNELFNHQLAHQFREADLQVVLQYQPIQNEEVIQGPKHKDFTFLTNRFPLIHPGHSEPYAVGLIAVDITSQIEAQKALTESETRYRAIVEEQAVFVFRSKDDGTFTYKNSAFNHFFSRVLSNQKNPKFLDLVAAEDLEHVRWSLKGISPTQPTVQYDHRYEGGEDKRWIRWVHRGIFNEKGQLAECQAVGFDVTETKNQTDQLIENEAVFKSLFSNTNDFIAIFRVDGDDFVLESVNRSAEKTLGFSFSQMTGRKLRDFIDATHENEILNRYKRAVETGSPQIVDEGVSVAGSQRQVQTTIVPIPGVSGKIERVAAVSRDVSAYKAIELDLRNAKQVADVANRAKTDFLASMSHELRTPLNVVLGMAHLLTESELNQEQIEYVSSISRSGQLLLGLIEDVLDISKIESGKIRLNFETFKIGELAQELSEVFSIPSSEKGISFAIHIESNSDLYVLGDIGRLRQILVNLVGNAIKFTDYGKVEVEIKTEGPEIAGEQMFKFRVSDTGVGIKKEFHTKLFQKFSQAESGDSRRFGGSGLGLVISKHLASLMGGDIGFESVFGEGSQFWFTARLQLTTKEEAQRRKERLNQAAGQVRWHHRSLKILAVDDNPDSLNVIRLFLRRLGHDVTTVGSGLEAFAALRESAFDLLLMDVQMPEMDGLEATKKIRESDSKFTDVPIIALTANAMIGDADRCFQAGMNDYLTKPIQMKSLKDILARWAFQLSGE